MAEPTLANSRFSPPAQDRMAQRNTLIENAPQISIRRAPPKIIPQTDLQSTVPWEEDVLTPRGNANHLSVIEEVTTSPSSSDTQSDQESLWSQRSSKSDFDEAYDMTDSDSEGDLPIKLSSSVKNRLAAARRHKYPSLVIPSPGTWPTIDKLKSAFSISPPTAAEDLQPEVMRLKPNSIRSASLASTPSLDGSLTSEELALASCPSTPDLRQCEDNDGLWEPPIQLDPSSISLLQHLSGESNYDQHETVVEVSKGAVEEMKQLVESPPITAPMRLNTRDLEPAGAVDTDEVLSALSVPSPGVFFASLDSSMARHTWSGRDNVPNTSTAKAFYGVPFRREPEPALPTSIATSFYGVPWAERPNNPVEHVLSIESPERDKPPPITAKRGVFSPSELVTEVDEIDENYDNELQESAAATLDRTQIWLRAQKEYMHAVCDESNLIDAFKDVPDATPKTPDHGDPASQDVSPSKKSVRFVDSVKRASEENATALRRRVSPIHDGTFWDGWQHAKRSQRARDVFQHRQARAEAEHVRRVSCGKQHLEQLNGRYEITTTLRPVQSRPVSNFLTSNTDDQKVEIIRRAERERQALEQLQTSSWHLSAQKEINGGQLLTSPIVQTFKKRKNVRILDLAGQAHCGWAWSVALDHPDAAVYTTVSSDAEAHVAGSTLDGPDNHSVVAALKPWELPFGDSEFDVISARNLFYHLRTICPGNSAEDEWDLTLRECLRVLKPGGFLEFVLLDAELVHPEPQCQALGVEFAFNLKTRGYDPCAGKSFLPRLKRAGFQHIKRAWMVLPVADVVPRWTDAGKTPGSNGSTETVVPANGSGREDYFGPVKTTPVQETVSGGGGGGGGGGDIDHTVPPVTGSTKDVRAMTGLVGARMWEQWIQKLNGEMGASESRCLESVAKALEEGGKGSSGWRSLVGWAMKAT